MYCNCTSVFKCTVIVHLYSNVIVNLYSNVIVNLYSNVIVHLYSNVIVHMYSNVSVHLYSNVMVHLYSNVIVHLYSNVILHLYSKYKFIMNSSQRFEGTVSRRLFFNDCACFDRILKIAAYENKIFQKFSIIFCWFSKIHPIGVKFGFELLTWSRRITFAFWISTPHIVAGVNLHPVHYTVDWLPSGCWR